MTDEKTQQPLGVASDLNAELGIAYRDVNIIVCDAKALQESQWQDTPPKMTGLWFMKCDENDYEDEMVNVTMQDSELWVIDCAIGSLPVAMYHDGLTNCLWRYA